MKSSTASLMLAALSLLGVAAPAPVVDTMYPYTGPAIPIADWVDQDVNGNGKGYPRLTEPPAVTPGYSNPTNNINVISLAYLPTGMNIHFQTPFSIGTTATVNWGTSSVLLDRSATGISKTYGRTPPCSLITAVTQCSEWFYDVPLTGLQPDTTYYYQIPGGNGTTPSQVLSFTTARAAGSTEPFTMAVLNDMGYTNAAGTMSQLQLAVAEGAAFAWHGGDISYADDWYSGILPCEDDWPVCYNGTSSSLPGGVVDNPDYLKPVPAGEVPSQGGPNGGDMSVLYESNWDLWQQWTNSLTTKIPYMVMPGNHEASCAEFDGAGGQLAAYLNDNRTNSTSSPPDYLTYYSCPESQRNFTAYMNRFHMPGDEIGGVGNFWYSFDYGLAHFISLDGETDFAYSPSYPFIRDDKNGETHPLPLETYPNDAGPFGTIDGNNWQDNTGYQQYKWLAQDLASIDRNKTPWVIAMSHRPMYSSNTAGYQSDVRSAFQGLLLKYGVDAYLSGHIHWYERMYPMTSSGAVDSPSIIAPNIYRTNPGVSMTHIINGMAGNIESHTELSGKVAAKTAVYDSTHYGFNKLTFFNATVMKFDFILGLDGSVGDELILVKNTTTTSSSTSSSSSMSSTATSSSSTKKPCRTRSANMTTTAATTPSTGYSATTTSSLNLTSTTSFSVTSTAASTSKNGTTTSIPNTITGVSGSTSSSSSTKKPCTRSSNGTITSTVSQMSASGTTAKLPPTTTSHATGASSTSSSASSNSSTASSQSFTSSISGILSSASSRVSGSSGTSTRTSTIIAVSTTSSISSGKTTSVAATGTSTGKYTTSTVYTTLTSVISSCAPTVTNCPYITAPTTVTSTKVAYTTVCPVSISGPGSGSGQSVTSAPLSTTSTFYKTITSTISSCAVTVQNCPYTTAPMVVTSVVVDYTTVCPVTAAPTGDFGASTPLPVPVPGGSSSPQRSKITSVPSSSAPLSSMKSVTPPSASKASNVIGTASAPSVPASSQKASSPSEPASLSPAQPAGASTPAPAPPAPEPSSSKTTSTPAGSVFASATTTAPAVHTGAASRMSIDASLLGGLLGLLVYIL